MTTDISVLERLPAESDQDSELNRCPLNTDDLCKPSTTTFAEF